MLPYCHAAMRLTHSVQLEHSGGHVELLEQPLHLRAVPDEGRDGREGGERQGKKEKHWEETTL